MVKDAKKAIIIIGLLIGLANSIVLYLSFLFAYFNDYVFSVNINLFNEAQVELVLFSLSMLIFLYAGFTEIKQEVMH